MPHVDLADVRLYYEEMGEGDPIVLMHGATGSIASESSGCGGLMPLLSSRYRAIHVETRGHCHSSNPSGALHYEEMAADIAGLIESLGLAPAHLMGVSDGAIIALLVGMRRPELVRSIVTIGANMQNDEVTRQANEVLNLESAERDNPEFCAQLAATHDPHHYPGYWRDLLRQLYANASDNLEYTEDDLRKIEAPTLLIAGERDKWANVEQTLLLRRAIPNSEMLILNHAGMSWMANHTVQYTRADIVGPVVMEFLDRAGG